MKTIWQGTKDSNPHNLGWNQALGFEDQNRS